MVNESGKQEATSTNELQPILTQTKVEHQMLTNARDGLLATLNWKTEGGTFARKLSSLRFAARQYQEHLERALTLEEHDGYMAFAVESCPHLSDKINHLKTEHGEIRTSLGMVITKLERLMPTEHAELEDLRHEMLDVVRKHDDHSQREIALIQDALLTDYGCGD